MADKFAITPQAASFKGRRALAAVKSDTVDLDNVERVYVSVAGNVKFLAASDTAGAEVTVAVVAGQEFPWLVKRIWDTGTTATLFFIR